ncbi:MAG: hypothetical protein HY690_08720 [Chloroflexi bacterium]|nr:hypothetical protein [Chloroflexota bacterium]
MAEQPTIANESLVESLGTPCCCRRRRASVGIAHEFFVESLETVVSLARSFGYVEHAGVNGVLRESLIERFLDHLLMPPYKAGTGVIVDSKGRQSGQCDVIIWDDGIFRPLYSARGAGIYLIESVVAVIEVKSTLKRDSIKQAMARTRDFKRMAILRPPTEERPNNYWGEEPGILPISMVFGFRSDIPGCEKKRAEDVAAEEGVDLPEYLQIVCVPCKTSWAFQKDGSEQYACDERHRFHEVLMPFAGVLNSLKSLSAKRGRPNLGAYMVPYNI